MYSRSLSGKLKDRERRVLEPERPIVGEDWRRPEPELAHSIIAPRGIGLARSALRWVLIAAVIFFIGAAGFFAYYFSIGGGSLPTSAGNIDIAITGPSQVPGGEPTQLQIVVTNRNQAALQLADLVITYPNGTRSVTNLPQNNTYSCSSREGATSTPYGLERQRICLGTIEAGGRRQGTVSAIFAGGSGEAVEVKVDLEYRLAGSSALFVASSNYQTVLSSSPVSISIEGNTETVSGQLVQFTATIASNANTPVKDVLLSLGYPFGFVFSSATPAPTRASIWELGDLSPGQKREVVIRGTLTGESGDERIFRFSVGTRGSPQDQSITTLLSDNSFKMQVSQPFLGLAVSVNKSSAAGAIVSPRENVNVVVNWQNNLSTAITDAVLVAKLGGIQIDGATVRSTDGFFRSTDNAVLWDKTTTNGALANLPAGAKGTVSFSFQVPSSDVLKSILNPSLTISVNAAGKRVSETGVPQNLQATASQRVVVASDLQVTAQGLYYANPFVSVGPLPPKAGTETTYAIVFSLTNTTNKIENAKLIATLPSYVRWIGIYSPSSENLSFSQGDSTVTWNIGTIEPGVGLGGLPPRQAAIAIGFTPSTSQIGQEPSLLQGISFSGTDAATKAAVTRAVKNVTTNIIGDPGFSPVNATVVR